MMIWPIPFAATISLPWTLAAVAAGLAVVGLGLYAALPVIVQPMLRAALSVHYRVRVTGVENVPKTGPLIIASNHLSWLDGFFVAAYTPRRGRALVSADIVNKPVLRQLALRSGIIPTPYTGPHAIRAALAAGRAALDEGSAIGIFPEGQISRNGFPGPFQRGIEMIVKGKDAVEVVPVAIDNLWGSFFSRSDGKFFGKWPQSFRRDVVLAYGPPLAKPVKAFAVRQAVLECLITARELIGTPSHPLETIDLGLPHWSHPALGLLTASAVDIHIEKAAVHQLGQKPGTVGMAVPGVVIRAVGEAGEVLPAETEGRLEARVAGRPGWTDAGARGSLDRDGFVRLAAGV
jgi:1-acyl-sn-glycerol-3-phosphate acyltransferase